MKGCSDTHHNLHWCIDIRPTSRRAPRLLRHHVLVGANTEAGPCSTSRCGTHISSSTRILGQSDVRALPVGQVFLPGVEWLTKMQNAQ